MIVEILVNTINKENPDPTRNARDCLKSGHLLLARERGWSWSPVEAPPLFKIVTVTDAADLESVTSYIKTWQREMVKEVVSHDPVTDVFRIKVMSSAESVGTNPVGVITEAEMAGFLSEWDADDVEECDCSVEFDIAAWDSMYFGTGYITYGADDSDIEFTKQSYDQETGVYIVFMDYSASSITSMAAAEAPLINGGCRIVGHNQPLKQIVFETDRDAIISFLESSMCRCLNKMIGRSAYYLPTTVGHGAEMTFAEFENTIIDIREV